MDDPGAGQELLEALRGAARTNPRALVRRMVTHPVRSFYPDTRRMMRAGETRKARARTFWGAKMDVVLPEVVSTALLRYGGFDPGTSALFIRQLRPGMTVIDVGAHIGYFSLLAAHLVGRSGHVHALEPTPSTFELLTANTRREPQIQRFRTAVWKDGGGVAFADFGVAFSAYNSSKRARLPTSVERIRGAPVLDIPSVSLDDHCRATGVRPDLVKIDAEGAEYEILEGMARFVLPELRPIVTLEVGDLSGQGTASSRQVIDKLLAHGYRAYESHFGILLDHEPRDHYAYGDLVFKPS